MIVYSFSIGIISRVFNGGLINMSNYEEEKNENINNELKKTDNSEAEEQVLFQETNEESETSEVGAEESYTPDFIMVHDGKEKKGKKQRNKNSSHIAKYILVGGISVAIALGVSIPSTYFLVKNQIESGKLKVSSTDVNNSGGSVSFTSDSNALSVTDAVKKVAPAVVSVSTKSVVNRGFYSQLQEGVGSGFIINEGGDILTNYHVIEGAKSVTVTFNNGKEYKAKVVNYDTVRDLALITLEDDVQVPGVATLGDSSTLQAGEDVIAIGNPLGKDFVGTVTKGIVSAASRTLENQDGTTSVYIQTDAAINPGNSGGPLINSKGEVIGINTAKISESGIEGIGFSIPINDAKSKIGTLSTPSTSANANNSETSSNSTADSSSNLMIGIIIKDIDAATAKQQGLVEGVQVRGVQNSSPAETAGIEPGDIITSFNGVAIKTSTQLNSEKAKLKAGDTVKIVVNRSGKEITLQITMKAQESQ